MRYYFIVGEPSGDLHASKVMNKIKKRDASAKFRFWGGDNMCKVAGESSMVRHISQTSFMGFNDVIRNLRTILGQISLCKRDIMAFQPDVVVLVDYAGFNLKIAKFAKSKGIKTFYYIAPKVWAWREGRVKAIKKYVDELFVIFPFEVSYFKNKGIKSHYFGNPLGDAISKGVAEAASKEEFFNTEGLDISKQTVALVAGSRRGEVRDNLGFMVQVANRYPNHQFVVAAVPWIPLEYYKSNISESVGNVSIVVDKTYSVMLHADAAIVTSGTATLETACIGTPEFVCYYTPPLTSIFGRFLIKIKYISLVNIILGREAIRELIHKHMTIENAVEELKAILPGGEKREKVLGEYEILNDLMGAGEVSGKVAEKMIELTK